MREGPELFKLMAHPAPRARDGAMAIIREVLEMGSKVALPLRDAALREGVILRHLLNALHTGGTAGALTLFVPSACMRHAYACMRHAYKHHTAAQRAAYSAMPLREVRLLLAHARVIIESCIQNVRLAPASPPSTRCTLVARQLCTPGTLVYACCHGFFPFFLLQFLFFGCAGSLPAPCRLLADSTPQPSSPGVQLRRRRPRHLSSLCIPSHSLARRIQKPGRSTGRQFLTASMILSMVLDSS